MYTVIIVGGVLIAVLLLLQLRNEAGAQSRQIKNMFGNLVLEVYCPSADEKNNTAIGQQKPRYVYPIVSTSITCGRQDSKKRYQVDLPIETSDESLRGTAVEIFIESDGTGPHLYVRRVEQPIVWVVNADKTSLRCLAEENTGKGSKAGVKTASGERSVSLHVPPALQKAAANGEFFREKISLFLGDEIWLGNTRLVVTCEKGEG